MITLRGIYLSISGISFFNLCFLNVLTDEATLAKWNHMYSLFVNWKLKVWSFFSSNLWRNICESLVAQQPAATHGLNIPNIHYCEKNIRSSSETRRVARIWKRGGLFWKSEKCANDVDSNFHWPWISFRRFVRNLRRNVSERSETQTFFPPKIRWSPKKKKKKRSSPKFRVIFRPKSKTQTFFPPKIRWSPKKKKKVFAKIQSDFSAEIQTSNVFSAQN